jgi:rRNA processing protein Krr1/Pno1
MEFHVYQCQTDRDFFVVTDEQHLDVLKSRNVCPMPGDKLEKIGVFGEQGKTRAAFDEEFAKRSIVSQGFYRFHSKTYDPLGEPPLAMPG